MNSMFARCSVTLCFLYLLASTVSAYAQNEKSLPVWEVDNQAIGQLGEPFADSQINIRPPRNLQKVEVATSPEMEKIGVYTYGWTPGGTFPSIENLSVTLTPYAKPSSDALDKTVAGMKRSIQESVEKVDFAGVKPGRFQGFEARSGTYTAQISGEKVLGLYLVGIDKIGSFAVSAMLPHSDATPEKIKTLRASILTFKRAE